MTLNTVAPNSIYGVLDSDVLNENGYELRLVTKGTASPDYTFDMAANTADVYDVISVKKANTIVATITGTPAAN